MSDGARESKADAEKHGAVKFVQIVVGMDNLVTQCGEVGDRHAQRRFRNEIELVEYEFGGAFREAACRTASAQVCVGLSCRLKAKIVGAREASPSPEEPRLDSFLSGIETLLEPPREDALL
jgi:hypothetical protein